MAIYKKHIFILILIYIIYSSIFIFNSSFLHQGKRYFVLFDDAMISMRYAKNLAAGDGLVWNSGDVKVEGYTNLLWTIIMAGFHKLNIDESKICLGIQIFACLLMILNLITLSKIFTLLVKEKDKYFCVFALFLTAFFYSLNYWSLSGMEVSIVTLLVSLSSMIAIQNLRKSSFSYLLYFILGINILIRVDLLGQALITIAYLSLIDKRNRFRHFFYGSSIILLFILGQTAFRFFYYNEFLPNTYYLKMTGIPLMYRISRGFYSTIGCFYTMNPLLILLPFFILKFRRQKELIYLCLLILTQVLYSIYVGGDAWEWTTGLNRYISIISPLYFVVFTLAVMRLKKVVFSKSQHAVVLRLKKSANALLAALCITAVLNISSAIFLPMFNQIQSLNWDQWTKLTRLFSVIEPIIVIFLFTGFYVSKINLSLLNNIRRYSIPLMSIITLLTFNSFYGPFSLAESLLMKKPFLFDSDIIWAKTGLKYKEIFTKDTVIAVTAAGATAYFSELNTIDLLGKVDKYVAHQKVNLADGLKKFIDFFPGHSKWDYDYSITKLQPDIIKNIRVPSRDSLDYCKQKYLDPDYKEENIDGFRFYIRKDSVNKLKNQ
ncbi:MAG: hypothetical protein RBU23_00505 [Candidatus Auribacterota bacterium]|jgi:hypothetical protein|nr:hypothetical protein [Candidatus Auribacterota bacterium]